MPRAVATVSIGIRPPICTANAASAPTPAMPQRPDDRSVALADPAAWRVGGVVLGGGCGGLLHGSMQELPPGAPD
ncbi:MULTISPECIES: hypothetical protein [Streptomyces]|uniref:hypothetical protein n=1 Tax=Streptomyces TaxID=1883 RepID=UPI0022597BB7|nr:hypothetical protein [Streptomyces sp. NBC_00160]MCX5308196.1 hypothetical protein [Streptomyces sp. NBC_00160]